MFVVQTLVSKYGIAKRVMISIALCTTKALVQVLQILNFITVSATSVKISALNLSHLDWLTKHLFYNLRSDGL